MEESKPTWGKRLALAGAVVSLAGGSIAIWNQLKPEEKVPELGGTWIVTNTVGRSNSGKFNGEVYVYDIGVQQSSAHELSGKGEQTAYNGKVAPSHFLLDVTGGKVTGDHTVMHYTVHGNRDFIGHLDLTPDPKDPKHWTGTFSHTADNTTGSTDVRIE